MNFLTLKNFVEVIPKKTYLKLVAKIKREGIEVMSDEDLRAMDRHIKIRTLRNLQAKMKKDKVPKKYLDFILMETYYDFGCMEVDAFLTKAKVYPDYMESFEHKRSNKTKN